MAVTALLKLAGFTNDLRYVDIAHDTLAQMRTPTGGGMMSQYPLGFGHWLQALAYALSRPFEIAIVGPPEDEATRALLARRRRASGRTRWWPMAHPARQHRLCPYLRIGI